MSQTAKSAKRSNRRERAAPRPIDLREIENFLWTLNLPVEPTIHVNGRQYPNVLLVVDFGQPIPAIHLDSTQTHDLMDQMRRAARLVYGRETANIRVSMDQSNGVYWASVS